ncbi:MAG: hypothetical protein L0J35_00540 [Tetragenococcus halophilus]|uniref:hypothetical protein n=1 Tax=Marinilactibacillus psychrotolerans TaxID=191770 RepID=UPI00264A5663|nr:hypothetical protein [Tetragenococcus halophilus]
MSEEYEITWREIVEKSVSVKAESVEDAVYKWENEIDCTWSDADINDEEIITSAGLHVDGKEVADYFRR